MKRRKIIPMLCLAASLAGYTGAGAYAFQSNELRVTSKVETGDVDIKIREEQKNDDGKLEPFVQNQIVVPGDIISKVVNIDNLATKSYIRAKVSYEQPHKVNDSAVADITLAPGEKTCGTDFPAGVYSFKTPENATVAFQIVPGNPFENIVVYVTGIADEKLDAEELSRLESLLYSVQEAATVDEAEALYNLVHDYLEVYLPDDVERIDAYILEKKPEEHTTGDTVTIKEGDVLIVPEEGLTLVSGAPHFSDKVTVELSDENLIGIPDAWFKAPDGYYYYKEPVEQSDSALLFEAIKFPGAWTEEISGAITGLTITADAVQYRNFNPDWDADSPWSGLEIETCVHDNLTNYYMEEIDCTADTKFTVSLDAKAAQLITDADDFMVGFGTLLPGDTYTDTLTVRNDNAHEAEIFFHTETPKGLSDEELDLVKNLQLVIKNGDKVIYEGSLEAVSLNKKISLGKFKKGEGTELTFSVTMPAEDQNIYAVRKTAVTWVFDCGWTDPTEEYSAPKTGINDNFFLTMGAATVFLLIGIFLLLTEKKEEK